MQLARAFASVQIFPLRWLQAMELPKIPSPELINSWHRSAQFRYPDFVPYIQIFQPYSSSDIWEYSIHFEPLTQLAYEIACEVELFPAREHWQPLEMLWRENNKSEIDFLFEIFPDQASLVEQAVTTYKLKYPSLCNSLQCSNLTHHSSTNQPLADNKPTGRSPLIKLACVIAITTIGSLAFLAFLTPPLPKRIHPTACQSEAEYKNSTPDFQPQGSPSSVLKQSPTLRPLPFDTLTPTYDKP